MIWIGTGAVMAIMLGILVLFSDGPLPSIQVDEGHIPRFGVIGRLDSLPVSSA